MTEFVTENTLYYLFSTIAQTLGALFGILAAFTLFKMQGLNEKLDNGMAEYLETKTVRYFLHMIKKQKEVTTLVENNNIKKIFDIIENNKVDFVEAVKKTTDLGDSAINWKYCIDQSRYRGQAQKGEDILTDILKLNRLSNLKKHYRTITKIKNDIKSIAITICLTIVICFIFIGMTGFTINNNSWLQSFLITGGLTLLSLGKIIRMICDMFK